MAGWAILNNDTIVNLIVADSKEIAESVTGLEAIPFLDYYVIGGKRIDGKIQKPKPDGDGYVWDDNIHEWVQS